MKLKLLNLLLAAFWGTVCTSFSQNSTYELATWKDFKTSAITFTFDDNCANQFTKALPIFDHYGYKASFYPVINWSPDWTTLKNMANNGHEIGSHSVTHPNSAMTENELSSSQSTINQNIPGFNCNTVTYPNCIAPDLNICAKYYIGGRICDGQVEGSTPRNYYQIGSIICGSSGNCNSLSSFQSYFNSAKNKKGWAVFLIHEVDNGSGYSPLASSIISNALAYLNTNGDDYWVATFRDAILYSKERNSASVSELTNTATEITMKVTTNLDNSIYNYPLSLRRALPDGWSDANVFQGGNRIESKIENGYIYFNAVPDGSTVTFSSGPVPTPPFVTFTKPSSDVTWEVENTEEISWTIENANEDTYKLYWNTGKGSVNVTGATASSEWTTEDGSFSWKVSNILTDTDANRWAAAGTNGYQGEWVALELSETSVVNGVIIKENAQYGGITGFEIQYSSNGQNYTTIYSGSTAGTNYSTSFAPVSAKYIRLFIVSANNVNINYFTVTGGTEKTELKPDITASGSYNWVIGKDYSGLSGYFTMEKISDNHIMATSAAVTLKSGNSSEGGDITIEGGYTSPSCDGTGTGAYFTGIYHNLFTEILGKTKTEVENKINSIWNHFFNPTGQNRVYYEVGNDMAYIYDVGSDDVRSEGMSYGMMICVQLNKKTQFDKLWKWAQTYMQYSSGNWDGYFAWQCNTNGTKKGGDNTSCAPDGEAYFITALFFAAHRWNEPSYAEEAQTILRKIMSKTGNGGVYNMFDANTKLITFVPYYDSRTYTDPSYNLPGFFELWARWSDTNKDFWKQAPDAARQLLRNSSHPTTGLFPDYSEFNGTPLNGQYISYDSRRYQYDALRCAMNVGMDFHWFGADDTNQTAMMTKLLNFFKADNYQHGQFDWDGGNPEGSYSEGMAGANGVGCFALENESLAKEYLNRLWQTNPPTGQWRYYNGMVYMLSMLNVSGNFKIYKPAPEQVDTTITDPYQVIFDGEIYTENTTFSTFYKCKIYNVTIEITGETTSLGEQKEEADFYIVPNPVKDRFKVHAKKGIQKIEIFNTEGSLVLSGDNTDEIRISSLSKGNYIVRIHDKEKTVMNKKIIIE
jgi:oligosaccharide reducing-end xylanase